MATIKIVLRKEKGKDGTQALAIQVIKDRKNSVVRIGHSILEKDWDAAAQQVKKSHPNSKRLNHLLLQKRAEASDKLLDLETQNKDLTSKSIKNHIKRKNGASFFTQSDLYLNNLKKNGKYGRYTSDLSRMSIFRDWLDRDITFPEITYNLLLEFSAWLRETRRIRERTVINYLLTIRTIYNQAFKSGVTDKKNYPFGEGKIVIKFPDSIKVGLNADEVKTLEGLELEGYAEHARDMWLLSFYFAGMRLSDFLRLRWSDFKDGRFQYGMTKNLKVDSLKVPDKVWHILDKYRNDLPKHGLVFPELKVIEDWDEYEVKRKIAFAGKRMAKELKQIVREAKIDKNISAHISRHTFGQLAGDKIAPQALQVLYRHAHLSTTVNYQGNFIHGKTDAALEKVLDF